MNVVTILDDVAARLPQTTALVWRSQWQEHSLSFAAFSDASRRIATLFRRRGLAAGDAIVVLLPMGGAVYQVVGAALRLGLVLVFVDPADWRATLARAVAGLPVRAFVGTPSVCALRWFVPALRQIRHAFVAGPALPGAESLHAAARCEPLASVERCADDALALLGFTSGTSGASKGVLRTHGVLRATYEALRAGLSLRPGEVHLATLPLFVLANLAAGVTSVIPRIAPQRPADVEAAAVLRQMQRWQVCAVVGSPRLLRTLAEAALHQRRPLDSIVRVFVGGAAVLPSTVDALVAAMPASTVTAVYGATEAEPIALDLASARAAGVLRAIAGGAGLPVGRPVGGLSVTVIDDRGGTPREACSAAAFALQRLPPRAAGEIVVCGPNVSRAYLDAADNRHNKLVVDGTVWHRTGDAGYLDEAGVLWLVGRCGRALQRDGRVLYPLQVEAALSALPRVVAGTLVAVRGRRVLVVQAPGFSAADLLAVGTQLSWCDADEVALVRHLPLDQRHQAKIRYAELVAALEREQWVRCVPLRRRSGPGHVADGISDP